MTFLVTWEPVLQLLIQLLAFSGGVVFFRGLFEEKREVLLAAALYMVNPWRYEYGLGQGNWQRGLAWSLVPWCLGLFFVLVRPKMQEKRAKKWMGMTLAGLGSVCALVAIGMLYPVLFCLSCVLAVYLLLAIPASKAEKDIKAVGVLAILGSGLIWALVQRDFLYYLLRDGVVYGAPIQNITPKGYTAADFLTTFAWQPGKPGLGLLLMAGLALWAYVRFVKEQKLLDRTKRWLGIAGVLCLPLASVYFPWELVQRLSPLTLKLVSQLETPAVFVGFAILLLPAVAIPAVSFLWTDRKKNKNGKERGRKL